VRIEWRADAQKSAIRFMTDQAGMRAVNTAVTALPDDPAPPGAFIRGEYRRLRVGSYRVLYRVKDDVITIERVDRVAS
jgi:mRNA-degrading endonuclease RelE of RelBE toxin-antitoxin system